LRYAAATRSITRKEKPVLAKIVSGGQTGVDRGALDFALDAGIPCGGWCPAGRKAEDGRIPRRYPLKPTPTAEHSERTERNVLDSDATLVLTRGEPAGGTALTIRLARRHRKPCLVIDMDHHVNPTLIGEWCRAQNVRILNIAGPRESNAPGISAEAKALLHKTFGGM
jgi:putative molybdenum carrier protein